MNKIQETELILNPDGSVYHLHLQPENIAENIIVVGDQERVAAISGRFDTIEFKIQNREFVTHTGRIGNKRITKPIKTRLKSLKIMPIINQNIKKIKPPKNIFQYFLNKIEYFLINLYQFLITKTKLHNKT